MNLFSVEDNTRITRRVYEHTWIKFYLLEKHVAHERVEVIIKKKWNLYK